MRWLAIPALVLGAFVTPASADCAGLDRNVRAALAAGDAKALPGLAAAVSAEPGCDGAYVDAARRAIALAVLEAGRSAKGEFAPAAVTAAAAIARPWQVSLALGDLRYGARDYAAATQAYEAAINEIRNPRAVPNPPGRDVEDYLATRAYQAKSLAPGYVASRGFRGEPAGLIVPTFRNFTAVSVPVPVRFDTDRATLTADGERAVDDLRAFLVSQGVKSLRLVGHTDERGSNAHNDALSAARADAVATALRADGVGCTIETRGAGEHQPFAADDRSKYSREDLDAFDRRVEFEVLE